jgi:hypothetical protein
MTKNFKRGQKLIEAFDPAANIMIPVTFVDWFNQSRTYARVRYENGHCLSVRTDTLIPVQEHNLKRSTESLLVCSYTDPLLGGENVENSKD